MRRDALTAKLRDGLSRVFGPDFDEVAVLYATLQAAEGRVMVDVGAHHGGSLRLFASAGWQVYAIEPDPANRARLLRRVRNRPNVVVDSRAIADQDGAIVTLYASELSTGISGLSPFHPSHRPAANVVTVRLDTLLAAVDEVTVLKTDTEGHDLPVLRTFPWYRLRPRGIVCEFEDRKTVPLGYDHRDMAEFLMKLGYAVFVSEWHPIVEYGQQHHWRSLRRYPTTLANPNGWGNLIAVDAGLADDLLRQTTKSARLLQRWRRAISILRR